MAGSASEMVYNSDHPAIDPYLVKELSDVVLPYGADPNKLQAVIMSARAGIIPLETRMERFFKFLEELGNRNTAMRKAGVTPEEFTELRKAYPDLDTIIEVKVAEFESQMITKVKDIAMGETRQNFSAATYLLEKANPAEFGSKGGISNNININLGDNLLAETMERLNSGYIHNQQS